MFASDRYMRALIIYGSQYGTTKRYAEKFSQMAGIPCTNYEELKDLEYEELLKESSIAKLLGYEYFDNYDEVAVYPKGYRNATNK